jgi:hypothetical protein
MSVVAMLTGPPGMKRDNFISKASDVCGWIDPSGAAAAELVTPPFLQKLEV